MLFGNGKVPASNLFCEPALSAQRHGPDFGAGEVSTGGPIHRCRAVIKGVNEFMCEGIFHVLFGEESVLTENDAVGRREAAAPREVAGGTAEMRC